MSCNILITGAEGFIGSHLTELLVREGYKVRALVLYNSFNSWGWLEESECRGDFEIIFGDIRDPQCCKRITAGIDIVFHLAALIAIPYSYVAPHSYVQTNVTGTLNICQAALDNGVSQIIHTSTSEVYGSALYVPIDEKHPLQAQSPYSASKIGADALAMSYYHSFNLPLTIARPFNTYGPRQSARAIIPTIIMQIAGGRQQIKVGNITPTRDFNYVTDTCLGLLSLARSANTIGEVVNIGSNCEISIVDTLCLIRELMHSQVEFIAETERIRPKKSEVSRLRCNNSKLVQFTDFKPQITLRAGLEKTIAWFCLEKNLHKYKIDLYNM